MYRNITISGGVATGTSTLLVHLRDCSTFENWEFFSGGEFMRKYAQEKGLFSKDSLIHHNASAYDEAFDREVDFGMRKRLTEKEHQMFEAWLSGFFAQKIPGTLKVLLYCSDDAVRVDRVANRDGISVEEAKQHLKEREQSNFTRWQQIYAKEWKEWVGKPKIDFWSPEIYDLVIDTFSHSKEETFEAVLQAYRG